MFENKLLRENGYEMFDDNIMPLIEMISLKIGRTEYTVSEIVEIYDHYFKSGYFIDFFVFSEKNYRPFDPKQVPFSLEIRDESNFRYLEDLLMKVAGSKRGIPVISIKRARSFILDQDKIELIVEKMQANCEKIAVRIESDLFDDYYDIVHKLLRASDYLFYDINENSIEANYFDVEKIKKTKAQYEIIVIHSPRKRRHNNGSYIDGGLTGLIDNTLRNEYLVHGFSGFADYAGLKDALPTEGGGHQGAALGMFYINQENKFFTVVNKDTKKGVKGHKYVLNLLFDAHHQRRLNDKKDCPAFYYMKAVLVDRGKSGSWGQWKYITMLRYISQIKKVYK